MKAYKDYKRINISWEHPRAHNTGKGYKYVFEHILIAEKVLGRYLKDGEVVHHLDGNRTNNANNNLVITDYKTHQLYHKRLRAFQACGDPNFKRCKFCKEWDDQTNMDEHTTNSSHREGIQECFYHKECGTKYFKEYKLRRHCGV